MTDSEIHLIRDTTYDLIDKNLNNTDYFIELANKQIKYLKDKNFILIVLFAVLLVCLILIIVILCYYVLHRYQQIEIDGFLLIF